jgi:hypothetical protein
VRDVIVEKRSDLRVHGEKKCTKVGIYLLQRSEANEAIEFSIDPWASFDHREAMQSFVLKRKIAFMISDHSNESMVSLYYITHHSTHKPPT